MDLFWTVGLYLMFFILLVGNYGALARTVVRWTKKPTKRTKRGIVQPKLTFKENVLCYIPIVQCVYLRKALYKRAPIATVIGAISGALILVRLINTFLIPINSYVMFFTSIGILVGMFMMLLLYGFITADCAKMYGYGWFLIILNFLIPFVACWFISSNIPYKMRTMYEKEIFNEQNGGAVIKRKHS